MPIYECRYVKPATGRLNTLRQGAFDEAELRDLLRRRGVEPVAVVAVPGEPATEPQLQLMRDRRIVIPAGLTKIEASDLISNFFERRPVADDRDHGIARMMRVEVTQYASKATIYRAILFALSQREDPAALGAWFAWRVYRNAFDRDTEGVGDPLDGRFTALGARIAGDARLSASLARMASRSHVHFRWFGRLAAPDGTVMEGDGERTEVYKFVLGELHAQGLLADIRQPEVRRMRGAGSSPARGEQEAGCLGNGLATMGAAGLLLIGWYLPFG